MSIKIKDKNFPGMICKLQDISDKTDRNPEKFKPIEIEISLFNISINFETHWDLVMYIEGLKNCRNWMKKEIEKL